MRFDLWDALYVVVVGSVVGFMLADRAPGSPLASVLLVLCLAWYLAHRLVTWSAWLFVTVLALLHLTAVWLDHTASFALFAWGSMLFAALPLRPAVIAVAALDLLPLPIALLRDGTLTRVHGLIPLTVLGLAFAVVAGTYIARLTDQNEERAAMIAELSASRAEVARLSHEAGVATERARLAAEIHDTLAQGFTSIITLAQAAAADPAQTARRLDQVVGTARDNLAEARALVAALSPADLHASGLGDAVRRQLSHLASQTGIRTACHLDARLPTLPTASQVVLLRSLQEALTNVRKHAHATTVEVSLTMTGPAVVLTVTDDGVGFVPPDPAPSGLAPSGRASAGLAQAGRAQAGLAQAGLAHGSGSGAAGVAPGSGIGAAAPVADDPAPVADAAASGVDGLASGGGGAVSGVVGVASGAGGAVSGVVGAASGAGGVASGGAGPGSAAGRPAPGSGFGLAGMRSRVEQAGGLCTVESRPGAGTTVTVQLA